MITEYLLIGFLSIGSFIIGLLPVVTIPDMTAAFVGIAELLGYASFFVSFSALGTCLTVWFVMHNVEFVISVINWIIKKIPTIN